MGIPVQIADRRVCQPVKQLSTVQCSAELVLVLLM